MKVDLFPFQRIALHQLRVQSAEALGSYRRTCTPQVVSFTAPTGAGKTVILASLIESIYFGDEDYPDQQDAIFVWLSDSPELNLQSKNKIDFMADRIRLDQCVTITDDSFDQEILDDGHIYFLNTQKLGKSSNLTKKGDSRSYTIWETLQNTMDEKYDRLYFIIDEAHRGMQGREAAKATTIMQKFLKGSREDNLSPVPIIIGVTATPERFNHLVSDTNSTIHKVIVTADEVRASGLLKDRIIIAYPEDTEANKDMAVLQAAADDWKQKWNHWAQYCHEQHYANVNPVFVIQVQNQTSGGISETDLDDCLKKIEERTGFTFENGDVVHTFGQTSSTLRINGIDVYYLEPSRIADEKTVKIVFFKENLSTGWDCPRAETMMSFRHANDATYIAQLLGRMVRTPMQRHIQVDDVLNDVHLYLPYFDAETVKDVVNALQSSEGGSIPTDVVGEAFGTRTYDTLTIRPVRPRMPRQPVQVPGQVSWEEAVRQTERPSAPVAEPSAFHTVPQSSGIFNTGNIPEVHQPASPNPTPSQQVKAVPYTPEIHPKNEPELPNPGFDREEIAKAINEAGLLSYEVRHALINDYLKSLYSLARLLSQSGLYASAKNDVITEIVEMIHQHISKLKSEGTYEDLAKQVLQFKLKTQTFDVFGGAVSDEFEADLFSTTDTDLERQFQLAEAKLGREGVSQKYGNRYGDWDNLAAYKIDVIIFANDTECIARLHTYAEKRFHDMDDEYRRKITSLSDSFRKKYDAIVSDGDIISKHNFRLPEVIQLEHNTVGTAYADHLFVDSDTGTAVIDLNNWEKAVLKAEEARPDFVCWLRNPPRKSWALCIPYEQNGETKAMYPDFLIIRKEGYSGYVIDVLEPHDGTRTDNLGKAQGFADYARKNPNVGRLQLIRLYGDKIKRLDMSKSSVRDKVSRAMSNDELDHIFDAESF